MVVSLKLLLQTLQIKIKALEVRVLGLHRHQGLAVRGPAVLALELLHHLQVEARRVEGPAVVAGVP